MYLRAKSCPRLFAHLETYFPEFSPIDSPRGMARKYFPGSQHLKDIDGDEMKDYRQTARNCIKFLDDVAALEKKVACTPGINGKPRFVDLPLSCPHRMSLNSTLESIGTTIRNSVTLSIGSYGEIFYTMRMRWRK